MACCTIVALFLCTVGGLVSGSYSPSSTSLYQTDGSLKVLTADNYPTLILDKNVVWMVEFYMAWCGYCQRFAPVYKDLAKSIYSWNKLVKVGVVECSNEVNTPVCQHYKITSVPTTKYFYPFNEWTNSGKKALHSYNIGLLKDDILRFIDSLELPKGWPSLSYHTLEEINKAHKQTDPLYVIIEGDNSTSGMEIILSSTSAERQTKLLRYVFDEQDDVLSSLVDENKLPSLIKVGRNGNYAVEILGLENDVEGSIKKIEEFLGVKLWSDDSKHTTDQTTEIVPTSPPRVINEDKVYLSDLMKALETSLVREIANHPNLEGQAVDVLRDYLDILIEFFPGSYMTTDKLKRLRKWIGDSQEIIVRDYLKFIKDQHIFESVESWIGCQGSIPGHRGYPCGLWTLFHTLTTRAYNNYLDDRNASHPRLVLKRMRQYIGNFFSCNNCRKNFLQESAGMEAQVKEPEDAVLWLWYQHNNVNQRLSGDITEDPLHPKIQFPSSKLCPTCFIVSQSKWNKTEVLNFLNLRYSLPNDTFPGSDSLSNANEMFRVPFYMNLISPIFILFYL